MTAVTEIDGGELPWLAPARLRLNHSWVQGRLAHGLLVYGTEGVGKRALAQWIARAVLCDRNRSELRACGECASCRLLRAGTHPDLTMLAPEEGKQQISVDQVREMSASLALTSFRQGYKVAVVEPAQQMTMAAANSLLKTLEEPASRTLLILVATRLSGLLPTLRSRCQQIAIAVPPETTARNWLAAAGGASVSPALFELARGAPLRALAYAESGVEERLQEVDAALSALASGRADVTQIAKRWASETLPERLLCMDYWLERLLRATIAGTDDRFTRDILPSGVKQLNIKRLFACVDRLRELRSRLERVALQRELAVESLLIELAAAIRLQAA